MDRDRNLLFGVFAVQLNKVSSDRLMGAAGAWAVDSGRGIGERLVEGGVIGDSDRALIERLVNEAVSAHDGDLEKTLLAFGGAAQVEKSYRGSIVLSPDGGVSIAPKGDSRGDSKGDSRGREDPGDVSTIRGLFETPGRYTNSIEHARGGMGRVLLVHDDHLGRDIALKELLPSMGEVSGDAPTALGEEHLSPVRFSAGVIARFLQKARITGQLEHPSIVPVYELGHRKDGSLYYTMKLVRGQSLAKAIESCGGLEERLRLLPHFVDLCQAIAYAHSRSIVHRDIKPANVMVGEFGETVVLDWGLAKKWDREDVHEAQLKETVLAMHLGDAVAAAKTAYGQVLGTPVYMPPEQAKGELEAVDERSDVYSLGVVLYEILTGEVPFDAKSMREVLSQVIEGRANPIADRAPDAPPELVAIAEKAMALAKGDRYRSAGALAKEVQRFQSGAMVQAHRYNVGDYTRFVWRRYRPWIVTGAVAMVVLVGITVVYLSELGERNASLTIARDNALVAERAERAERERAEEMIKQLERAAYAQSIQIIQDHVDRGEMRVAQALLLMTDERYRGWEWGYLLRETDSSVMTLLGHSESVEDAQYSRDGRRIVTASMDSTAKVWDAQTGEELVTLSGHNRDVLRASFSPDGGRVVTVSHGTTVKVWDVESGIELFTVESMERMYSGSFSPDGARLLTSSVDGTVRIWDSFTGEELMVSRGHEDIVMDSSFSPDGAKFATVSPDRTAKIWDSMTGRVLLTKELGDVYFYSARFDPSGERIVSEASDSTVRIWDAATGDDLITLRGHLSYITDAEFGPFGDYVVTASSDGSARVWSAHSARELKTIWGFGNYMSSASLSPDGLHILTGTGNSTAKVWNSNPGILRGPGNSIVSAAFSFDERRVVTASLDGTVMLWDVSLIDFPQIMEGHAERATGASFSHDDSRILSTSKDGEAIIWDSDDGTLLFRLAELDDPIEEAYFRSDDSEILTRSEGGRVTIWNGVSGEKRYSITGHDDEITDIKYSPSGARIATGSKDGTARIWDAASGAELHRLEEPEGRIRRVTFSPDGRLLLTVSSGKFVRIWDVASGRGLCTLEERLDEVRSVSFNPDGTRVVTVAFGEVGEDGLTSEPVKVWDTRTGEEMFFLRGHTNDVLNAMYSPDGRRIVTGGYDNTAKVWDAETGANLVTLRGHSYEVRVEGFSPNGRQIATVSRDGTVRIWTAKDWREQL